MTDCQRPLLATQNLEQKVGGQQLSLDKKLVTKQRLNFFIWNYSFDFPSEILYSGISDDLS